jgi:hypothetical protein
MAHSTEVVVRSWRATTSISLGAQVAGSNRAVTARRGVTQGQLAKVLGLPQSAVSHRPQGRTRDTCDAR